MATAYGPEPTGIRALVTVLVTVDTAVTAESPDWVTKAVVPSGEMATLSGATPLPGMAI